MKKGVTVSVIAIAVTIMFIAISTATIIGTRTMKSASYEEYMSKLKRVEDAVNLYQNKNEKLPITGEAITKEGLNNDVISTIEKKGDNNNKLYIVDMSKMGIANVSIGSGSFEEGDVFLLAENSYNIYYLKGFEYKSKRYYCFER